VLHGEARSPCYDAVHTRRIVFVGDEYWLVEDRLRAGTPHRYDLRFHLAPEAWSATEVSGGVVRAPGLALVFPGVLSPVLEEGWYAPEYGRKLRAPIVSVAVEGVRNAVFLTLVAPLDEGEPAPELRVRSAAEPVVVVEVTSTGRRDVVTWTRDEATWWRLSADGDSTCVRARRSES
jgi:hypothetical protein